MSQLKDLTRKTSLRAVWGTLILLVALVLMVTGRPVPESLGMAFGALVLSMFPREGK